MFPCKLIRRNEPQAFMRPYSVIKLNPSLSGAQKFTERLIGATVCHRELEQADKAFRKAVVRWGASPAHGELEALLQQELAGWFCPELLALVAMKNGRGDLKGQRLQCCRDQLGSHVILES